MKITGQISRGAILRQADKYSRFAEQCRELGRVDKPIDARIAN
jgi:hypothetical protein